MNPEKAHGWLGFALELMPLPAWQALVISLIVAASLTWLAEFLIPDEWSNARAKVALYGGAALLGILCAICVWNAFPAAPVGLVGALLGLAGRQLAAKRWPSLSPHEVVLLKRNAQGEVIGVKEGDDKTKYFHPEDTQPKP